MRNLLSGGAERAVIRLAARLGGMDSIDTAILQRFPDLDQSEQGRLAAIARAAMEGAQNLPLTDIETGFEQSRLPVNPFIRDSQESGDRFDYGVEIEWIDTDSGTEGSFALRIRSEVELTQGEVRNEAEDFAIRIITDYPDRGGHALPENIEFGEFTIVWAERRF